ncbi:pyrimidine dimer DNA glycosylase/endonuclease V [Methanobacterium paludis]|uniref:DNA-(Apurinic or apyrimidinic site) lyase pyrimidine dimer DNA glycosylase n=1 Tax=Methanobacterium paludis (strain DSM 25820 / JCM 18151 / SWAN1) TaxID=868131 RepID=F6D5S2_METPW|nr:pyrimidine dimer DNA glycosylase/endonuclease V [Methanobacterium paludis]AEG18254.1 DNA-(apurinic or apyrimidinic site) lyase; pyrimidine dimer DNA glycosylase [Methanobacterium paludis]
MRLWSLHPKYLDCKGLVALWREGLLARTVLKGETRGYRNHPQLERFKNQPDPVVAIDTYLLNVYKESQLRGYKFNRGKIGDKFTNYKIEVTRGQILYELEHLKRKLDVRDHVRYLELENLDIPLINPIFKVVEGDVEPWELVH